MKASIIGSTLLTLFLASAAAYADVDEKLIKLDRQWGEATKPEQLKNLLTEKFILLDKNGTANRQDLMDDIVEQAATGETYVAGGYQVQKIEDNIAIMVHSAGSGDDKHWSMHVWRKHDGKWKVAASASVPMDD